MSSSVDQVPYEPTDPKTSRGRDSSELDSIDEPKGFDAEFAVEIRSLFGSDRGNGLFGKATPAEPAPTAEAPSDTEPDNETVEPEENETEPDNETVEPEDNETEPDNETVEPKLFATPVVVPRKADDAKPSVGLFLPRPEEKPERAAPTLTGLSLAAGKPAEPASVPNLFVSSDVAPAEVAFVPAEEVGERRRYRWLLILLGLLLLGGAIWLTIMAQTNDTVDAPVTTIAPVPTTEVTTTEAPVTTAPTTVSTTGAPASTATTETTTAPTVATTAPQVQPTTPRRPATTTRRPTAPPTSAAPTATVPIPDLTLPPPTAITTPLPPATTAETAATAPAEPAAEG